MLNKKINKWLARVTFNKQVYNLGYFQKKEAARTYNEKASELFGDYAALNEISDDEQ